VAFILLNAGADPNVLDLKGNNLLMNLAEPKLLKALIEKGADIHHRNNKGESVLNTAMNERLVDIVFLLIKHADNVNLFEELSEPTTMYHLNKLPSVQKQQVLLKIRSKLTDDQFYSLQFANKPEVRVKSVVFRDSGVKPVKKEGRVDKLIAEHEDKIRRAKPSREQ
jgi:hypothetical protein